MALAALSRPLHTFMQGLHIGRLSEDLIFALWRYVLAGGLCYALLLVYGPGVPLGYVWDSYLEKVRHFFYGSSLFRKVG